MRKHRLERLMIVLEIGAVIGMAVSIAVKNREAVQNSAICYLLFDATRRTVRGE